MIMKDYIINNYECQSCSTDTNTNLPLLRKGLDCTRTWEFPDTDAKFDWSKIITTKQTVLTQLGANILLSQICRSL